MSRQVFGIVPVIALMVGSGGHVMSEARTVDQIRNVVLVHGGFVDGSGWHGVYKSLKRNGYNVSIV
jgi:hypothetical protein